MQLFTVIQNHSKKFMIITARSILCIAPTQLISIIIIWPRYSIPREWKNYAMQYKKVQKSSWIIIIIITQHLTRRVSGDESQEHAFYGRRCAQCY